MLSYCDILMSCLSLSDYYVTAQCCAILPRQVVLVSVCPSVRQPVTLKYCGHIVWVTCSSTIISRLISLGSLCSLRRDLFQREQSQILTGMGVR